MATDFGARAKSAASRRRRIGLVADHDVVASAVLGTDRLATAQRDSVVVTFTLPPRQWAEEQFSTCRLGDVRRTRRAVDVATAFAANPSGSTPHQTEDWPELKATYRLFDSEGVTFESLASPHWEATRARTRGHWLLLEDTTELNFGIHRKTQGLGPTGGMGAGFHLHSSLMVAAESEEIVGLAGQELFYRQPAKKRKKESGYRIKQRDRESQVWGKLIDRIGAPPPEVRFTHVMDRGADNFEVYCHLLEQQSDWVVRAGRLQRNVRDAKGDEVSVQGFLQTLPVRGAYEVAVPPRRGHSARTAQVEVRYGLIGMPAPRQASPWLKNQGIKLIAMWLVEVRENAPPEGAAPLRWVLYTSHPVINLAEAQAVIGFYKKRWLIEEFHKALKTGCNLESRQYQTSDRLEALTGIQSIVAVRLLQLKSVARSDPERPASELVPAKWHKTLRILRPKAARRGPWNVYQFFRELAGLGGFLGRKCDGEPGWITLWRGVDRLIQAIGYEQKRQKCG